MYLDLVQGGIFKELAVHGIREVPHTLLLKQELEEGMVVVEIGANIGYYLLTEAAIVKDKGKIYAFEPDSRNLDILRKNIALNRYAPIVDLYPLAVSDKSQNLKIHLTEKTNLSTLLNPDRVDPARRNQWRSQDTQSVSLDEFLKGKLPVNLIRMDVEGFEVEVFKGMRETVKNAPSKFKVLFELHMHTYYLAEQNRLEPVMRDLFELGLRPKVLIPTWGIQPQTYKELGYSPDRVIKSKFGDSAFYYNVKLEDVIRLTCYHPNSTKFMLLEKVK